MHRYLAFSGDSYYANGGWLDFKGSAPTQDEAERIASAILAEQFADGPWWHVVDSESGEIVASKSGHYCGQVNEN